MVTRDRSGREEVDEGAEKVQISHYKINKCWGVMYNMIDIIYM